MHGGFEVEYKADEKSFLPKPKKLSMWGSKAQGTLTAEI